MENNVRETNYNLKHEYQKSVERAKIKRTYSKRKCNGMNAIFFMDTHDLDVQFAMLI